MNMFKSTTLFLATLGVAGAVALSIDTAKVSADATTTLQVSTFTPSINNVYSGNAVNESKIGGTWIVKQGIKGIIRNRAGAAKIITNTMGGKAGIIFNSYYYDVTAGLKPLLEWREVPAQSAFDATFRNLINAGVSRSDATNVAEAIKIAINLFV